MRSHIASNRPRAIYSGSFGREGRSPRETLITTVRSWRTPWKGSWSVNILSSHYEIGLSINNGRTHPIGDHGECVDIARLDSDGMLRLRVRIVHFRSLKPERVRGDCGRQRRFFLKPVSDAPMAKVRQAGYTTVRDEDVGGFKIAVYDSIVVKILGTFCKVRNLSHWRESAGQSN